jgi:hypothetical protein
MADLEAIREKIGDINHKIANLGLSVIDESTGQQRMEYWLPEEIKEMLIEEFKRPDGQKTNIALVKYFLGGFTWYASEYEPRPDEWIGDFFGVVDGQFKEMGSFNLKEMRDVRLRNIWPVERDFHFVPKPLSEC